MASAYTNTPPGSPTSSARFRRDRARAVSDALGGTPATSPTRQATFRANRDATFQTVMGLAAQAVQQNQMQALVAALTAQPAQQQAVVQGAGQQQNQPAAAGQQNAVVAAQVPQVVPPRVGGIIINKGEQFAWTGGSILNIPPRPKTMAAYRPEEFKSLAKVEKECMTGLPESHRLSTPDKIATASDTKLVSLQTWIDRLKKVIEDRGMDTVFRMIENGVEYYLLEEFGRADVARVTRWVEELRQLACAYDERNLYMSGQMLLASLDLEMLKKTERDTNPDASGPEVFAAVINIHQSLNTSAVRVLTEQLQKMKLAKEPAENVETFSEKVLDIAKRIRGAGPSTCPQDLPTLVYECFQESTTPVFALEATELLRKANKGDRTVEDWEQAITELKSIYRSLVTRSIWNAKKTHKEKTEVQAMQATIKTLQKTVTDMGKKQGGKSDWKAGGAETRTCFNCGKEGHLKADCKQGKKGKDSKKSGGKDGDKKDGAPTDGFDRKLAPKDGDSETKTVSGEVHKWCGTCKRWSKGNKAHLTDEHIKGKGKTPAAAAGGLAAAEDDSNDATATLRLVSGYMAKIGKPRKKGSCYMCKVCECLVEHEDTEHHRGFTHRNKEDALQLAKLEEQVTRKLSEVGDWIVVASRKVKKATGSLKDQAGHLSS